MLAPSGLAGIANHHQMAVHVLALPGRNDALRTAETKEIARDGVQWDALCP